MFAGHKNIRCPRGNDNEENSLARLEYTKMYFCNSGFPYILRKVLAWSNVQIQLALKGIPF